MTDLDPGVPKSPLAALFLPAGFTPPDSRWQSVTDVNVTMALLK